MFHAKVVDLSGCLHIFFCYASISKAAVPMIFYGTEFRPLFCVFAYALKCVCVCGQGATWLWDFGGQEVPAQVSMSGLQISVPLFSAVPPLPVIASLQAIDKHHNVGGCLPRKP